MSYVSRDLRQINLIMRLCIAEAILQTIRLFWLIHAANQRLDVAIKLHFQVDTDAAVERCARAVEI